jgi:hypothetical protein
MAFEDGDMSVSDSISLGGRPRCEKKLLYNGNGISISGTNYSIKKLMVMHDENTLFTIQRMTLSFVDLHGGINIMIVHETYLLPSTC